MVRTVLTVARKRLVPNSAPLMAVLGWPG